MREYKTMNDTSIAGDSGTHQRPVMTVLGSSPTGDSGTAGPATTPPHHPEARDESSLEWLLLWRPHLLIKWSSHNSLRTAAM